MKHPGSNNRGESWEMGAPELANPILKAISFTATSAGGGLLVIADMRHLRPQDIDADEYTLLLYYSHLSRNNGWQKQSERCPAYAAMISVQGKLNPNTG